MTVTCGIDEDLDTPLPVRDELGPGTGTVDLAVNAWGFGDSMDPGYPGPVCAAVAQRLHSLPATQGRSLSTVNVPVSARRQVPVFTTTATPRPPRPSSMLPTRITGNLELNRHGNGGLLSVAPLVERVQAVAAPGSRACHGLSETRSAEVARAATVTTSALPTSLSLTNLDPLVAPLLDFETWLAVFGDGILPDVSPTRTSAPRGELALSPSESCRY